MCPLTVVLNLPLCLFKGAAIAKKKMMKKFGWYKHSEDGGGTTADISVMVTVFDLVLYTYIYKTPLYHVHLCATESDSDDDIAYLDDDSGFCASLM